MCKQKRLAIMMDADLLEYLYEVIWVSIFEKLVKIYKGYYYIIQSTGGGGVVANRFINIVSAIFTRILGDGLKMAWIPDLVSKSQTVKSNSGTC